LERDLAAVRSKRAEREKVQGALRLREPTDGQGGTIGDGPQMLSKGEDRRIDEASEQNGHDDVIMMDAKPENTVTEGPMLDKPNTLSTPKKPEAEQANPIPLGMSKAATNSKAPSLTIDPTPAPKESNSSQVITDGHGGPPNSLDHPLETPTTANLRENDFETMFNDTEAIDGADGVGFGLEFAVDAHDLNNTDFDNVAMGNEDLASMNATSNEDINTLLPGLENYVNANDDLPIVNLVTGSTLLNSTVAKADTTSAPQALNPAPTESNFDHMFSSNDFMETTEDFEMDESGDINDLEDFDDWFKPNST
jgi:hypothetical protein